MLNQRLKDFLVSRILPNVQMPAQYIGGELNMVRKDHRELKGTLCLAFPDAYTLGMSHHGLQVLYSLMNGRDDWACERVFTPWHDMEASLRGQNVPLYSLETFTPLSQFDVVGFSLPYELCSPNILTMLDLAGIPLRSEQRTMADPLIIAGGPCAQNPEPLAPFFDLFVIGDGEPSLPLICDRWRDLKDQCGDGELAAAEAGRQQRAELLAELAAQLPFAYVPRFYRPEYDEGRVAALKRMAPDVPELIQPCILADLDGSPLPARPLVPYVRCVHDRMALEIMRGCPGQCRFCQSTVIKRPLRARSVETIVDAAIESYANTGYNEISLLSLSSSDYPHFQQLVRRLQEVFRPLGVNISVPSLRVNEQLREIADLIGNERRSSLTLAPEVACDDMRQQIHKQIKNDDLYEGCRGAFQNNYESVKLYFMCGLPGERQADLDGIIEMAETIAKLRKEVCGRYARVTASVSNFVPKPHTPYQWNAMQTREYFREAHRRLRDQRRVRSVVVKCHNIETSLLEGVLSRGDRRVADAIERAWQSGARMESWHEHFNAQRWWTSLADSGIDVEKMLHEPYDPEDKLPWDHVNVKAGRPFLEKERSRSAVQLKSMVEVQ